MAGRKAKPPSKKKRAASTQELRLKAQFRGFTRYLQRAGASYRQIWETGRVGDGEHDPMICDVVQYATFSSWATKAGWRKRRDEHWEEVRKRVTAHAQTTAVQSEIKEIGDLESLKSTVLEKIMGDATKGIDPAMPKSLEGAVGAFVALDKRVSQKRDHVLDVTIRSAELDRETHKVASKGSLALEGEVLKQGDIDAMARALAEARVAVAITDNGEGDALPLASVTHPATEPLLPDDEQQEVASDDKANDGKAKGE